MNILKALLKLSWLARCSRSGKVFEYFGSRVAWIQKGKCQTKITMTLTKSNEYFIVNWDLWQVRFFIKKNPIAFIPRKCNSTFSFYQGFDIFINESRQAWMSSFCKRNNNSAITQPCTSILKQNAIKCDIVVWDILLIYTRFSKITAKF